MTQRKTRPFIFQTAHAAIACLFLLVFYSLSFSAEKVVATVGGSQIKEAELEEAVSRQIPQGGFHGEIEGSRREKYRRDALEELIEIELFFREGLKRGMIALQGAVEKVVDANIRKLGSAAALDKELARGGLDMESFRERIRKYETANAVVRAVQKESRHSDREVREYYEENTARYKRPEALHLFQILLTVEPTAMEKVWEEKKKIAEQVRDKAAGGEDFADLAYRFSEDPYKYKGGDLGFIHKGRLTPQELEDAAFGLKQGEISGVIRTIHGFHILKAGERKPGELLPFDEVREKIRKEIDKKRFESKKQELLDNLRKEYPVEISGMAD